MRDDFWIPAKSTLASHSSRLINQKRAGMLREGKRGNDEHSSRHAGAYQAGIQRKFVIPI